MRSQLEVRLITAERVRRLRLHDRLNILTKIIEMHPLFGKGKEKPHLTRQSMRYDTKEITSQKKRETAGSYSSIRLGGNFPTSVAARKSIPALSDFSMENSSETCTCRHLPALHPVAFPTSFQSVRCWSFHRLEWQKRCSRVWAVLPPPPHHQHLSSPRSPNRFKYVPTGVCPNFSQ